MIEHAFSRFARAWAVWVGRSWTFALVMLATLGYATAQLTIGIGEAVQAALGAWTGIVSIVMLVLLQHSSNREGMERKLEAQELIRVTRARNRLLKVDEMDESELDRLEEEMKREAERNP